MSPPQWCWPGLVSPLGSLVTLCAGEVRQLEKPQCEFAEEEGVPFHPPPSKGVGIHFPGWKGRHSVEQGSSHRACVPNVRSKIKSLFFPSLNRIIPLVKFQNCLFFFSFLHFLFYYYGQQAYLYGSCFSSQCIPKGVS